jgi:hypothetical protein
MACADNNVTRWLNIIRAEFREMPGLILTRPQFQRLWGLDMETCDRVIKELVDAHFLQARAGRSYGPNGSTQYLTCVEETPPFMES